jgi:hypothetical protein
MNHCIRCGEPAFDEPEPFEYIGRCRYCKLEVVGEQEGFALEWRETGDEQEKWKKCPSGCLLVLKWYEMPYTLECPWCQSKDTRQSGPSDGVMWYCMRCRNDWRVGVAGEVIGYWKSICKPSKGMVGSYGFGDWVEVPSGCLLILVERPL